MGGGPPPARRPPCGWAGGVHYVRAGSQQMHGFSARGLLAGKYIVEGITAIIFVVVVALYLLLEGRRAYD